MNMLGREGISRRDFLRGGVTSAAAVGAMSLAPTANDSYLAPLAQALGPHTAYAKESFLTDGQEFVFEVVGVDEVGIQVVDPNVKSARRHGQSPRTVPQERGLFERSDFHDPERT